VVLEPPGHPSDSSEQREAELAAVARLGEMLGVTLSPGKIALKSGRTLQVDGVSDTVICEVYAHHGALKAAQVHKVMDDAARLRTAERMLGGERRKILVFVDATVARSFKSGWRAESLASDGIEVVVVELDQALKTRIIAAQLRQVR